ncbi:uncharacterized protein LOC125941060 [Dermacentor silvarum]|uniref:uncharacterized protein LOC125941060 n=1 Tax=Dermacentor silvarum TaxID=543639 RepID=UPI002101C920|nr:uncharacterized protein LOC125941060 [Dermacentor silvarum]
MMQALEVNKTLEALVVNVTGTQPQFEVSCLFNLIRKIDVFSRLKLNWVHPRGSDFAKGVRASQVPTIWRSLDESGVEDAEKFLEALVSIRNVGLALLECTTLAKQRVVQKLTDTLTRIKCLRKVPLLYHIRKSPRNTPVSPLKSETQIRQPPNLIQGR